MHIVKLCDNAVHNTPPESLIQSAALRTTLNRSGLEIALNNSLTAPVYSNGDKAVTEIGYVNAGLNRCFGKCAQQRHGNAPRNAISDAAKASGARMSVLETQSCNEMQLHSIEKTDSRLSDSICIPIRTPIRSGTKFGLKWEKYRNDSG